MGSFFELVYSTSFLTATSEHQHFVDTQRVSEKPQTYLISTTVQLAETISNVKVSK
jgi:hypothetical protein